MLPEEKQKELLVQKAVFCKNGRNRTEIKQRQGSYELKDL